MNNSTPRKKTEQTREISGTKIPSLASLPKFQNDPRVAEFSTRIKEFYRHKRILRISKIRDEKKKSQVSFFDAKKKGGTRPEFWAYFIAMLFFPGMLIGLFSPIARHLPIPVAYLMNGVLMFVAIELVDWVMLKKYQTIANQEANADLVGMSAADLIQVEDELFHEVETNPNRKTAWVAGRFVVFALSAIGWLLTLVVLDQFGVFRRLAGNPLSIPVYLGSLGVGIFLGNWVWKSISHWGRFSVRTLIHYWPMAIYVCVGVAYVIKHLRAGL